MAFLVRDFLETQEGLVFAVVAGEIEQGRVLSFLRYVRQGAGYRKLATDSANRLLQAEFPHYLYYSKLRDVQLHGVPIHHIHRHYQPRQRLRSILAAAERDPLESKLVRLGERLAREGVSLDQMGVTGSLLIGAQNPASDIDVVIYGRTAFAKARVAIERLMEQGRLDRLDEALWRATYARRGCALSFEEYLWHERRKQNKGAIEGTKFDITLVEEEAVVDRRRYKKNGPWTGRAKVIDDVFAFAYPARYSLAHPHVSEALSFTATYAGQARKGETIELSGQLEQAEDGGCRLVVGSSREAPGEYIKVIHPE